MATFTWKAPTASDWSTVGDWTPTTGAPPGAPGHTGVDTANLDSNTTGSPGFYSITVGSGETFDLAALDMSGTNHLDPDLLIGGSLLTNTLNYSGNKPVEISIKSGGVFDIRTGLTDVGVADTITVHANNVGGTAGSGGLLILGSLSVINSSVTYTFENSSATKFNTGEIEYATGFTTGTKSVTQTITGVAWGDQFVIGGANFSGDKATLSGNTLTVKSGSTTVFTMNGVSLLGGSKATFAVNGDVIAAVCYARGTVILTPDGELPVERLRVGKQVITLVDGEEVARPVKWLGRRRIDLTGHPRSETVAPIRIQQDAFADNTPHRDLVVSPDHAIFAGGKLICARQLVNGTTIRQETGWTAVDYYHVELDQHAILFAEGLTAESYIDTGNSSFFANSGEPTMLHPDLTDKSAYPTREAGSCAPFVWDAESVQPIWQRLADRAAEFGRPVPAQATSTDARLHLVAKGRAIKPIYDNAGLAIFALPRGASEVRLVSRAARPTDARPWLEDRRTLGVRVARIVLRSADDVREVPMDHPELADGWWAVERNGQAMSRWTNGEAVVPLPAMRGDTLLEIHLAGAMTYVVAAAPGGQAERHAA